MLLMTTVAVATLSGCAGIPLPGAGDAEPVGSAGPVQTRSVAGFILIEDSAMTEQEFQDRAQRLWDTGDDSCTAPDGFDDIAAGGVVSIVQPDGAVAEGTLSTGVWDSDVMSANHLNGCGFPFTVPDVAIGEGEYLVHVGGDDRAAAVVSGGEIRTGPRVIFR
jgi:hypothetical protein